MIERVSAIDVVRNACMLHGGSQAQTMRCSDGFQYVVKFQNNPQGRRTLFNDAFGTLLARHLKLPVADTAIVEVSEEIIRNSERLVIQLKHGRVPCQAGLCFGSRYIGRFGPRAFRKNNVCYGLLCPEMNVTNLTEFLGMLVFDKWTSNIDRREVLFVGWLGKRNFQVVMIDQGYCFGGASWKLLHHPITGVYSQPRVYASVTGLESFEPWLQRLENTISLPLLLEFANFIPREWYEGDQRALEMLLLALDDRRKRVRDFIAITLKEETRSFPQPLRHRIEPLERVQCAGKAM